MAMVLAAGSCGRSEMIRRPDPSFHEYSWACASDGVNAHSTAASRTLRAIFWCELVSLTEVDPSHKARGLPHRCNDLRGFIDPAPTILQCRLQKRFDRRRHPLEEFVDAGGVLAAGFGEIRPPAAAAADDGGDFLDDPPGLDAR